VRSSSIGSMNRALAVIGRSSVEPSDSADLLLRTRRIVHLDSIDVQCGGCGRPLRLTIADLRDRYTVNCGECEGKSAQVVRHVGYSVPRDLLKLPALIAILTPAHPGSSPVARCADRSVAERLNAGEHGATLSSRRRLLHQHIQTAVIAQTTIEQKFLPN
jgi:hypothetical protein